MTAHRLIPTLILCGALVSYVKAKSISGDLDIMIQPTVDTRVENDTTGLDGVMAGSSDLYANDSRHENISCESGSCESTFFELLSQGSASEEPARLSLDDDGETINPETSDSDGQNKCGHGDVGQYDDYGTEGERGEMENCNEWSDDYENDKMTFEIISMVIATIGAICNGLVILTWSKIQPFNNTTFLLTLLGVADFIFVVTMFVVNLFFISEKSFSYSVSWFFFIFVYVSYVAQYTSIFTTLLVSFTRYAAIRFPFKVQVWLKKSVIQFAILIIVFISLLAAFPASSNLCLFLYIYVPTLDELGEKGPMTRSNNRIHGTDCMNFNIDDVMGRLPNATVLPCVQEKESFTNDYPVERKIEVCTFISTYQSSFPVLTAALMNILPWIFVIPLNLLLINQVRKAFTMRKKTLSKDEQNNITMDVVVVIMTLQSIIAYPTFFVAETLTNRIDWNYFFDGKPPFPISHEATRELTTWRDSLQMINSSVNILAYSACGSRFRRLLVEEVLRCGKRGKCLSKTGPDDKVSSFADQKTNFSVSHWLSKTRSDSQAQAN